MDEDGHVVADESSGSYVTGECVITWTGIPWRDEMTGILRLSDMCVQMHVSILLQGMMDLAMLLWGLRTLRIRLIW